MLRPFTFLLLVSSSAAFAAEGDDYFEKKVRPLLIERCFECHSAEKKVKGGLALDSREGWAVGGDSGPAIVPGKPEESLFITAIRYVDKDLQMPEKRKLPDAEIAVFEEWVKMGAPDPRTGAVAVKKQTGLSVEEGRKFWSYAPLRKVDPPAVKDAAWPRNEVDHFILAKLEAAGQRPGPDASPEVLARRLSLNLTGLPPGGGEKSAFDVQLAGLLESPHFGEHWGRHWLDVARFAESSGGGRTLLFKDAWRYRDYVIESLNADVPYDRFLREQIAGDLVKAEGAERARLLAASGFLALGPTNYEEQDKQQLRFDVIDEQLDTIGKTVLGQTMGCARCHDHKFDPISQRDYYAMAGIFASTRTLHNYTDNVARWVDADLPLPPAEEEKLAAHEKAVAALKSEIAEAKKAEAKGGKKAGANVEAKDLQGIVVDDAEAKAIGEWEHSTRIEGWVGAGYRSDKNEGKGAKTMTFVPKIAKSGRFEVRLAYIAGAGRADRVPVTILHADGEKEIEVDQSVVPPIEGRFVSLGTYRFEADGAGFVLISNEGTKGYVIADAVQFLPEEMAAEIAKEKSDGKSRVKELEATLKKLNADGPVRPFAMSVREVVEDIGGTEIRIRGVVGQKGEKVERGFLAVLPQPASVDFPKTESGRRELAEWLTNRENPLTARVFVNRVWHWLFGQGIVRTVDNFGTTGEAPSHPELLDYLAAEFMEHGWSVKWLVREIVSSRTWQLAVGDNPADPDNRLFSHALRRRLDAEQLRDTMLSASGELDLTLLGPNITGAGVIDANDTSAQNIEYKYEFSDTRRSVYTPAFRNKRLDLFEAFDFGNISAPLGARTTSTVAPQALYFLNHPWVAERAKLAATRVLAQPGDDAARLESAVRVTLGRAPLPREKERFLAFLAAAGDAEDARRAAWGQVFHTLFASVDFRFVE